MTTTAKLAASRRRARHVLVAMALLASILALAALIAVKTMPIPNDVRYVGSPACESCHLEEHDGWRHSLHPKMMRRVNGESVVVADLSADNADLLFDPAQAVWAIGSKWEQQFMGHDGNTETLLPGAWLVGPARWERIGWDGWRVPVPVQRCHGCHTVGLDVATGRFLEPGIGCESCHGAGSWHTETLGLGRIHTSLDAQICGQCHTRGRASDGVHFFPVGYRPGQDLTDYFREQIPSPGQNSAYWWGNGRERKRHQEYFAWKQGGHANSLKSLVDTYDGRYGEVTGECINCHSAEGVLARRGAGLELNEVKLGITCAVCHNVHGRLDEARIECSECHGSGAFYHTPERNTSHVACPEQAVVTCIDCHMPLTGFNGGAFTLHSHAPGIVPPRDTRAYGIPSSCANGGCHAGRDQEWLETTFARHYRRSECLEGPPCPSSASTPVGVAELSGVTR